MINQTLVNALVDAINADEINAEAQIDKAWIAADNSYIENDIAYLLNNDGQCLGVFFAPFPAVPTQRVLVDYINDRPGITVTGGTRISESGEVNMTAEQARAFLRTSRRDDLVFDVGTGDSFTKGFDVAS